MTKLVNFLNDESGAAAAEYALILALVAVAIVGALTALGGDIGAAFNNIGGSIKTAAP
jgi:pilus assembly protein Flp/PilA